MHPHEKQKRSDLKSNPVWVSRYSNTIRSLRKSKGLNQSELADEIGVDRGAISDIEIGRTEPMLSTLETMANFFDITIDELVGRTPLTEPKARKLSAEDLTYMRNMAPLERIADIEHNLGHLKTIFVDVMGRREK